MINIIDSKQKDIIISSLKLNDYEDNIKQIIRNKLLSLNKEIEIWQDDKENVLVYDSKQDSILFLEGKDAKLLLKSFVDKQISDNKLKIKAIVVNSMVNIFEDLGFKYTASDNLFNTIIYHYEIQHKDNYFDKYVKVYIDKPIGFLHAYNVDYNLFNQGYFLDGDNILDCVIVNESAILEEFYGYIIGMIIQKDKKIYIVDKLSDYNNEELNKYLNEFISENDKIIWSKEEK